MTHHRKSYLESNVTKEPEKLSEEQRKLQVTGGSTFILSLPKEWATKNELKKGSLMVVRTEDDGSLSISSSSFPKKEKQDEAFILSLPKEWATKNELKKGSLMVVRTEDDGSLSISSSSFPKKEKQDEAFI